MEHGCLLDHSDHGRIKSIGTEKAFGSSFQHRRTNLDTAMGATLSTIEERACTTCDVKCKLVVDNGGTFAGLTPVDFVSAAEGRADALRIAAALIGAAGKGYNPDHHRLKVPGVPAGAIDVGLHASTHNAKFNGGPLSEEQVQKIRSCTDTFTLQVDLQDFKVLVGSPSNDDATGVIGYVGLVITLASLVEYNRAISFYGGKTREGNIAHVSICGWDIAGFSTFIEARSAFGLVVADGQNYPDGKPFYTGNGFPAIMKADVDHPVEPRAKVQKTE